MKFGPRAQSVMEYMLLISVVTAAVVYMLPRVKRTTQSMMKTAADQIGDQEGADQTFNDVEKAYLVNSSSTSATRINNLRTESGGTIIQKYDEGQTTRTTSFTNAGWREE